MICKNLNLKNRVGELLVFLFRLLIILLFFYSDFLLPTDDFLSMRDGYWESPNNPLILINVHKDSSSFDMKVIYGGHSIYYDEVKLRCDSKDICNIYYVATKKDIGLVIKILTSEKFKVLKTPFEILKGGKKAIPLFKINAIFEYDDPSLPPKK